MTIKTPIKAIVTGATGMVGEGVLHECLLRDEISEVLMINRRPPEISHPKLKEIIHKNFMDISAIEEELKDYNACFFCLGVSSVGMEADKYYQLTYTLTMYMAETLSRLNPQMAFTYVSGAGTDSSELGRIRWARVKGKTENRLAQLPFKAVYNFRPGFMSPTKGLKRVHPLYKWLGWLTPVIKLLFPNGVSTLKQLADAMINVAISGYPKQILEVKDIKAAAAHQVA